MKITSALRSPTSHEVEPKRTPASHAELRASIAKALERVDGRKPSAATVDLLTAQASLETGSGGQMYNFNFGGIKGSGPDGATARCRTKEVVDGHEVTIRDGFRAYASLDEGALDYVRTMRQRFGSAMGFAEHGDVGGFAHALKNAGYYTASEADYARGLSRLAGMPAASLPTHAASPSLSLNNRSLTSPDQSTLSRIETSLDSSFVASARRIHATDSDADDDDA